VMLMAQAESIAKVGEFGGVTLADAR